MKEDSPLPQRLRAAGPGLGAPSEAEIEIRALELAKSDGRTEISESDLYRAAAELGGAGVVTPDSDIANPVTGKLVAWDEPVGSEGNCAHENPPDDEQSVAEQLVDEGIREADHDSRVAAAEEDDERDR